MMPVFPTKLSSRRKMAYSIGGETVEQSIAAGGDQVLLPAASGDVGRIPGPLKFIVEAAPPVVVAEHGDPGGAARPIVTGQAEIAGKRPAVSLRSGQHVVLVGRLEHAVEDLSFLGARRTLAKNVGGALKVIDALRCDT